MRGLFLPLTFALIALGAFSLLNLVGRQQGPSLPRETVAEQSTDTDIGTPKPVESELTQPAQLSIEEVSFEIAEDIASVESQEETASQSIPTQSEDLVEVEDAPQAEIAAVAAVVSNDPEIIDAEAELIEPVRVEGIAQDTIEDDLLIIEDIMQPEDVPLGLDLMLVELDEADQPRFGRVSLNQAGNLAIIQGRGVAGTRLDLLLNDRVISETSISPGGTWSVYEPAVLPIGIHTLTLRTNLADGRTGVSDQRIGVRIDANAPAEQTPAAILYEGDTLVSILSGPRFVGRLTPQAIVFGDGNPRLVGKSPAGARVRLVLDGQDIGDAATMIIGADGTWDFPVPVDQMQSLMIIQENLVSGGEEARLSLSLPTHANADSAHTLAYGSGQVFFFPGSL